MDAQWWLPPVIAFVISFFTSMVGISGAFLLLPIQISFLGLTGPAVSATNLVFNLIAIPAGVYRYWREKRVLWPLALIVVAGTTPGVIVGGFIRLSVLADAQTLQGVRRLRVAVDRRAHGERHFQIAQSDRCSGRTRRIARPRAEVLRPRTGL